MVMDFILGMFDGHGQSFWRCLIVMDSIFGNVWWSWTIFLGMFGGHGQCLWGCLMVMDSVCGDV